MHDEYPNIWFHVLAVIVVYEVLREVQMAPFEGEHFTVIKMPVYLSILVFTD